MIPDDIYNSASNYRLYIADKLLGTAENGASYIDMAKELGKADRTIRIQLGICPFDPKRPDAQRGNFVNTLNKIYAILALKDGIEIVQGNGTKDENPFRTQVKCKHISIRTKKGSNAFYYKYKVRGYSIFEGEPSDYDLYIQHKANLHNRKITDKHKRLGDKHIYDEMDLFISHMSGEYRHFTERQVEIMKSHISYVTDEVQIQRLGQMLRDMVKLCNLDLETGGLGAVARASIHFLYGAYCMYHGDDLTTAKSELLLASSLTANVKSPAARRLHDLAEQYLDYLHGGSSSTSGSFADALMSVPTDIQEDVSNWLPDSPLAGNRNFRDIISKIRQTRAQEHSDLLRMDIYSAPDMQVKVGGIVSVLGAEPVRVDKIRKDLTKSMRVKLRQRSAVTKKR